MNKAIHFLEEILQKIYRILLEPFAKNSNRITDKVRNRSTVILFILLNFVFHMSNVIGSQKNTYKYILALGVILVILSILLNLDEELKFVPWKKGFFLSYLLLGGAVLFSDYMVIKEIGYHFGGLLIFLFLPFYFATSNLKNKEKYWNHFILGTKIYFFLYVIATLWKRPFDETYRYTAFFRNPNTLGIYCLGMAIIFLFSINRKMIKSAKWDAYIADTIGLGITGWFLFVSESRTAWLSTLVVGAFWFLLGFLNQIKNGKSKLKFLGVLLLIGILSCSYLILSEKIFLKVGSSISSPYVFENEIPIVRRFHSVGDLLGIKSSKVEETKKTNNILVTQERGSFVYTAMRIEGISDENLTQLIGTLNIQSSGRIGIIQEYIRNMNIFGHSSRSLRFNEKVVFAHSHNNIIQFGYDYGIGTMLLYLLFLVMLLGSFVKKMKSFVKNGDISLLPILTTIGILVMSQTEYMGVVFQHLIVFMFFATLGFFMEESQ